MSTSTNRGATDANRGYAQANTKGMSQAQAQEAKRAFDEQKAKNDAAKK